MNRTVTSPPGATPPPRERGAALVFFVICVVSLIAVAAASSMLALSSQRVGNESARRMKAFYLADSGAQIANHKLRALSGISLASTSAESLAGGVADVQVTPLGPDLYQVNSTGTFDGIAQAVEMHVQFTTAFAMTGAVQINIHPSVTVSSPSVPFTLEAAAQISGEDHDTAGSLLVDQSQATYGIVLNPLPGALDVGVSVDSLGGATLNGSPAETANTVHGQGEVFDDLLIHARANADVSVAGGVILDDLSAGAYGTAALPLLTYVNLGSEATFHLTQSMVGHGTLVIEVGDLTTVPALLMADTSEWHGLIVVYCTGQAEVPGGGLVELTHHAKIVGALSVNLTGVGTTLTGAGDVFKAGVATASVKYCSAIVATATGVSAVVPKSARVVAYRKIQP